MSTEAIAFVEGVPPGSIEVAVRAQFPPEIEQVVAEVRHLRHEADRATEAASASLRIAAQELHAQGWSMRDIGTALELSHQRVHQLLTRGPAAHGTR